jgi:hypothetical protein
MLVYSPQVKLVSLIAALFAWTLYINSAELQSPEVWESLNGWKNAIFALLLLGTIVSFSFSIPDNSIRRIIPWLGRIYVPFQIILLFWAVEISLFIWSIRFYSDTINGHLSFISWFCYGFTPILSIGCLGGGFGALMIVMTLPGWLMGCSVLGLIYYIMAAKGLAPLCVVMSGGLKIGVVVLATSKGLLGGEILSQGDISPSQDDSTDGLIDGLSFPPAP